MGAPAITVEDIIAKYDLDNILYINKIPIDKVCLGPKPILNPLSIKYKAWWKEHKRKCVNGEWVNHGKDWKWVPGSLFFYVNDWHIQLNKKGSKSKTKSKGKPMLRDLEWIKHFVYNVARGFSGFENDDEYSCHDVLKLAIEDPTTDLDVFIEEYEMAEVIKEAVYTSKGTPKKYMDPYKYLTRYFKESMGRALFQNYAQDVVDIESRGTGKSYNMSGLAAHNFLMDGAQDYDEYLEELANKTPMASETLIGAVDTKYSGDTIRKMRFGLDNLEGEYTIGEYSYAPPLSRKFSGSWESGKYVIQEYDKNVGGQWLKRGTKSIFKHRSFKDNPFAANGTRPGFSVIDEVGFMGNLLAALGQMVECTHNGAEKFGTIWMTGTGGDMDGGATEAVKAVFYDPKTYSCVGFMDYFEGSGREIGFFIPAWMGLNQFKDDLGNTNVEAAISYLLRIRERKRKGQDKSAYNSELCQRPIFPSEAFLLDGGNIFPTADLKEHLGFVESTTDADVVGLNGTMIVSGEGKAEFKVDINARPCRYPIGKDDDKAGCVVVWASPDKDSQYGWYVAGNDPYDQDKASTSVSLGSLIVFQRASLDNGCNHDRIVAEYTARPQFARDFYEQCRRILMWYNASCLYENEKIGIKTHFEMKNSLSLLAYTPTILKSNANSTVARMYGQHMSTPIKNEAELFLRDWLMEDAGDGRLNLHFIYSPQILKELINYNETGNFDRVIALMLAVIQLKQMHRIVVKKKQDIKDTIDPFFKRKSYDNNHGIPQQIRRNTLNKQLPGFAFPKGF